MWLAWEWISIIQWMMDHPSQALVEPQAPSTHLPHFQADSVLTNESSGVQLFSVDFRGSAVIWTVSSFKNLLHSSVQCDADCSTAKVLGLEKEGLLVIKPECVCMCAGSGMTAVKEGDEESKGQTRDQGWMWLWGDFTRAPVVCTSLVVTVHRGEQNV
ncbi:hypothetical protein C8R44DRAFT_749094 [Mycena epipterygia]|nr:hypothetical protein C8R44DRAFT_749094 [Mycena epipterygia]